MCAQQMLHLDYSNPQERRNISKLYMNAMGSIQNQHQQFFCQHNNAFSVYTLALASTIAVCQHELERICKKEYASASPFLC